MTSTRKPTSTQPRTTVHAPTAIGAVPRRSAQAALQCTSRWKSLLALGGLAILFTCSPAIAQTSSLFDGRSLDDWEFDSDYWRVEAGAIVGEIPKGQTLNKNTWMVWRGGELRDFDLRLQVKLAGAPAANAAIFSSRVLRRFGIQEQAR